MASGCRQGQLDPWRGMASCLKASKLLVCRFMRFMERYAEEHDLGFTKKQVGV